MLPLIDGRVDPVLVQDGAVQVEIAVVLGLARINAVVAVAILAALSVIEVEAVGDELTCRLCAVPDAVHESPVAVELALDLHLELEHLGRAVGVVAAARRQRVYQVAAHFDHAIDRIRTLVAAEHVYARVVSVCRLLLNDHIIIVLVVIVATLFGARRFLLRLEQRYELVQERVRSRLLDADCGFLFDCGAISARHGRK